MSKYFNLLNANILKLIACLFMLLDHIGYMFCPDVMILRILGRISFPIFAYFIAEGCKYTKNRLKHFLTIFILGVIFQIVYTISNNFDGSYLNIFITFSISILLIYLLQLIKHLIIDKNNIVLSILCTILLIVSIFLVYFMCNLSKFNINSKLVLDYDFYGAILPLIISLFEFRRYNTYNKILKKLDSKYPTLILFTLGLFLLAITSRAYLHNINIEWFSFISLIFMLFYNGMRGHYNLKYFFYVFYPIHLVILEIIYLIIH